MRVAHTVVLVCENKLEGHILYGWLAACLVSPIVLVLSGLPMFRIRLIDGKYIVYPYI